MFLKVRAKTWVITVNLHLLRHETRWKTDLYVEFEIFVHLVDVGEDVLHDSRDDAAEVRVRHHSLQSATSTLLVVRG